MRSFIRFNGVETSMANIRVVDNEFNEMMVGELRTVFGEKAQFNIRPAANFTNEAQTDNIFNGIITGQYESEAPINISVYYNISPMEDFKSEDELPDADLVVPAFLGFRK